MGSVAPPEGQTTVGESSPVAVLSSTSSIESYWYCEVPTAEDWGNNRCMMYRRMLPVLGVHFAMGTEQEKHFLV